MKTFNLLALAALFTLGACAPQSEAGGECEVDDDCVDGLECHHEHHEEGEDAEHEEHDEGGESHGVCEEAGAHDHEDE